MIISKVRLRRTRGAQGALARTLLHGSTDDRAHGLIWSLFSSTGAESRDFLYREIEPGRFITVAARPPQNPHHLWDIESKAYAPELESDQRLAFVLRANPAMAAHVPGRGRGVRVDAVMHAKYKLSPKERQSFTGAEAAALDWLEERADNLGAHFDRERCSATGYRQVIVRKMNGGTVAFSEINFEGMLTVTDPARLTDALFKGIGKARSYGCGLMLVRSA